MQKNEIYEAVITGMTAEGSGVCRVEGMAVFVPMTAVGDVVRVRIVKVLKSYAFGIIEEVLTPSPDRMEPDCPVFRQCGGCVYRHIHYEAELKVKAQLVEDAFARIGGLSPAYEPILGADSRCGYRNKAQYPAAQQEGALVCGFYARHSHRVIPHTACALQPEIFTRLLDDLLPALTQAGVEAYREDTHTGELRHIYLRRGYHSGEIMLCFVVRRSIRKKIAALLPGILERFPEVVSVMESVNAERTNVILGRKLTCLSGKERITDTMCGIPVTLSPQSFYQVHTQQAERLYGIAGEYAALTGKELVLDLYCGAGTIGLSMAHKAARIVGAEIVPEAVENARENAERSGIGNAQFICGDAEKVAGMLAAQSMHPDVIVLDPPRKGCSAGTIRDCAAMQPDRIVMISCNPATAARDAAAFSDRGYAVQKVRAVDLFPGTAHVECVVLMSRNKA